MIEQVTLHSLLRKGPIFVISLKVLTENQYMHTGAYFMKDLERIISIPY